MTPPSEGPVLHEACASLAGLLGKWQGSGSGFYPTIEDFAYAEEVEFTHNGKPFLAYRQKTWHPSTGAPMHAETGYWRPQAGGVIEIVLAHPFGIVEIQEGTIDGNRIAVRSKELHGTATAKEITDVTRSFTLDGDVLSYEIAMAAVGEPLTAHLEATLHRI